MRPLSKNQIKAIKKLHSKKGRDESGLFIASGLNVVQAALEFNFPGIESLLVYSTQTDLSKLPPLPKSTNLHSVSENEFNTISPEKNPQGIAFVARRPDTAFSPDCAIGRRTLYLDRVNDPGNLGTLMRSALWFGFKTILLSPDSVDPFNPKVVRASAGAFAKLRLVENVGIEQLKELAMNFSVKLLATKADDGESIEMITNEINAHFFLMLGSEAHGLSSDLQELADISISIPKTGFGESLNLAVAGSIVMYALRNSG